MRRSGLLALVAALVAIVAGCGTAVLLPDGRVLLLNVVAKAYDPGAGRVTNLSSPPTERAYATATLLQDGRVLIVGGTGGFTGTVNIGGAGTEQPATALATADLYDPSSDTYAPTGSMAEARAFHTATLMGDGRVLIVGGGAPQVQGPSGSGPTAGSVPRPEIYDPATGTFGPAGGAPVVERVMGSATLLPDGRVLLAGGVTPAPTIDTASAPPDDDGIPTAEAELFDPATGTFSATGSMTMPRVWHTATPLDDGRVLIVGGTVEVNVTESSGQVDPTMQTAEIFDPATGTFSATGSPGAPRMGHAAALLDGGRVLVSGGMDADQATSETLARSAEVFDPASGTFEPTGDMVGGHAFHTATALSDGGVLIAGFSEATLMGMTAETTVDLLSSAELYDPGAGTFTTVEVEPAPMPLPTPA